jgi:hypothetical protein
MKEIIGSFSEFYNLLASLRDGRVLFRGQANALHSLVPGIGRAHPDYVPSPELERVLLKEFKKRGVPHVSGSRPISEWDWLILGQHHGLKTRLLDWTSEWRVALYFAMLPHDEMHRVPFSVFILPNPTLTAYRRLPNGVFSSEADYYFRAPKIHPRITGQQAYVSAHRNPYVPLDHPDLIQFSFLPFPELRRGIAQMLARERVTAAELIPGLDGICCALVDQPRITIGIKLARPKIKNEADWLPVPPSVVGKKVGGIRREIIKRRTLAVALDFVAVESMIGIPCYLDDKLFGFLKYANRVRTQFTFLRPDGSSTFVLRGTDDNFPRLKLLLEHVERLMPAEPVFIRKIARAR